MFHLLVAIFITFNFNNGNFANECNIETCNENTNIKHNLYTKSSNEILVYTVATHETDGLNRYISSTQQNRIEPKILGFGEKWKGGNDIRNKPGGGWKVNLLKQEIEKYKNDKDQIILFTDAYDVIFLHNLNEISKRFKESNARVLFGAEVFCWPDATLADKYPKSDSNTRYLNSGLYIGYANDLWNVLNYKAIDNEDDDQLFFTKAFLDENFRKSSHIDLDYKCKIFQNMNGATTNLEIINVDNVTTTGEPPFAYKIRNLKHKTEPIILHGNGPSKVNMNYLGNYVANAWNPIDGCVYCKEKTIKLQNTEMIKENDELPPMVLFALFIEENTPFLVEWFQKVAMHAYPRKRIHLFIHNAMKYHSKHVDDFLGIYKNEYASVKEIKADDGITEWNARDLSLEQCRTKESQYYFSLDSIAHLDNPNTLKLLIEQNRTIVAPMLIRAGKSWSNFWGALSKDGYYSRSNDYMDIVHNERRGLWNVPYIANAYLLNATLLQQYDSSRINFVNGNLDADMAFCAHLRSLDVFLYVSNRLDFGHLVQTSSFDITRTEPEMYQIFDNEQDWEERFIHPDYPENFNPSNTPQQPCPDVFWFPIVSRQFTEALINMMENFGKWSDGGNSDKRLEGGYEAVPTRDIHMSQVGWEPHWLEFLRKYVRPLQEYVFIGYFHDPPRSLMNFVVRYKPDEQPSLRPHHDSSTYTINIALNQQGVDYEGGGCRFIRYNCSVVDTKPGWLLIHPGRLTHFHEGLIVTKGVRYIMISFVDP